MVPHGALVPFRPRNDPFKRYASELGTLPASPTLTVAVCRDVFHRGRSRQSRMPLLVDRRAPNDLQVALCGTLQAASQGARPSFNRKARVCLGRRCACRLSSAASPCEQLQGRSWPCIGSTWPITKGDCHSPAIVARLAALDRRLCGRLARANKCALYSCCRCTLRLEGRNNRVECLIDARSGVCAALEDRKTLSHAPFDHINVFDQIHLVCQHEQRRVVLCSLTAHGAHLFAAFCKSTAIRCIDNPEHGVDPCIVVRSPEGTQRSLSPNIPRAYGVRRIRKGAYGEAECGCNAVLRCWLALCGLVADEPAGDNRRLACIIQASIAHGITSMHKRVRTG